MMEFFSVFVPGFVSVFLLGMQSRLVNSGNYWGGAVCSFSIAVFQSLLWHHLMQKQDLISVLAYGLSGASAITTALWVHQRFFGKTANDRSTIRLNPSKG